MVLLLALLSLQTLDGREVHLNPSEIVSVGEAPSDLLTSGAKCVVTLTNGKFLAVAESCPEIMRRLKEAGG